MTATQDTPTPPTADMIPADLNAVVALAIHMAINGDTSLIEKIREDTRPTADAQENT